MKYAIGDIVFVKRNPTATGNSTKLQSIFGGPLVIVKVLPGDTYQVKRVNEFNDRGFETTAHVSQLKIWRGTQDSEVELNSDRNLSCDSEIEEDEELIEIRKQRRILDC